MFFVIPEMPSKPFVMVYKKLPDHFKNLEFEHTQNPDPSILRNPNPNIKKAGSAALPPATGRPNTS